MGIPMTPLEWGLDATVALLLVGLAGRILFTRDLFEATVLFIAFGLTLSLAWVRLGAANVALAEAALGAGVTGALFLTAFHRLARRGLAHPLDRQRYRADELHDRSSRGRADRGDDPKPALLDVGILHGPLWLRASMALAGLAVTGGIAARLLTLADRPPSLPILVEAHLAETGVSNPVTAVLLNFRAYDTLLEVAVLVVAMIAVGSLDRGSRAFVRDPEELEEDPVLDALSRLVVPLAGVAAVYLVWVGSHGPGGAFQAGALLAGAGVLLVAAGLMGPVTEGAAPIRALAVMGLAIFIAVGAGSMPWTGSFLAYPPGTEYGLILLVEAVLALSIAVVLIELFVDVPAVPHVDPALAKVDPTGDPLGRRISPDGAVIRNPDEER